MITSIFKNSFCILAFLFISINAIAQPGNITFTPISAKPGDLVTIVGVNFPGTIARTDVFFGNTKVTAYTSASTTTLRVTVPIGATYGPITVLDKLNNRYGHSRQFFSPIFSKPKGSFDANDMTTSGMFSTGTNPYNVAVGDVDGDGKPDAVVVNYGANTVSVLRNTSTVGNINFATKLDFATGTNPYSVTLADIDNDTKLDIVVVNNGSSTISVLKNTSTIGAVSFAVNVDKPTGLSGSGSTGIAVADIDSDGWQDVLVCNGGNSKVSFLKNTSTTTAINFAAKIEYTTGTTPRGIAIGDIDGDGKLDIITTNAGASSISVIRNTMTISGSLTLATKIDYIVGLDPVSVALGDITADGKLDVVVSNYSATNISTLRNNSVSGTVTLVAAVNKSAIPFPETISITDIDADGKVDVMFASNASSFAVLKNTTTATTPTYAASVDFGTGSLTYAHAMGDIDGDGKIDAVVLTNFNNAIVVVRNAPVYSTNANLSALTTTAGAISPTFTANTTSYTATVSNATTSITVTPTKQQDSAKLEIQLNGGAYTSIASGFPSSALTLNLGANTINIRVTAQDGTTINIYTLTVTRAAPPTITSISPTSGAVGTTVTITGTFFSSTPVNNVVFFGAAKATVTAATTTSLTVTIPIGATYAPITILNTVSVLTASSKQYFNTTFKPNKGSITNIDMTASANFTVNTDPQQVAIGDIDGDGKADAVVVDYGNSKVSVLRNTSTTGAVSFATKVDFTTTTRPYSVALADMNNDGKLDIITADFLSATVSVFRNTSTSGTVSFATKVDKSSGIALATHQFLAVADIDGDGKLDVVVANGGTNDISVLRNTSTTTIISFATFITFSTVNGPSGIAIGDINNDGKPDVVVSGETSFITGKVSILKNTSVSGTISFATKADYTVGGGCSYVSLGDMNGDGFNDIITGNTSSNNVSVLINYSDATGLSIDPVKNFATGTNGSIVSIADIDGDGKLDIAVAGNAGGGVIVLRNTTTATFSLSFAPYIVFASAPSSKGVACADIDGDGKVDITAVSYLSSNLVVLRNTPILSSNNNLSDLTLYLSKSLNPVFDSLTTSYTSRAFNYESTTLIKATKAQDSAKIDLQINGGTYTALASAVLSTQLNLNVGNNIINVRVTAQNGNTKIYTINIYRACLAPSSTTNLAICPNQLPFTWNTLVFTKAESKGIIIINANNCDSLALLNLTLKANSTSTTTLSACDSLVWNGTTYKTSGSYVYHTLNSVGCDSAASLNLTIKKSTTSWTDVTICITQLPYTWNGVSYTTSGFYTKTGFINSKGCDSVAYLNLTVNSLPNAGAINGISSFCRTTGSTTLTSTGSAGGVWSSSNSARVSVTSGGVVTATLGGNYIIYYTITNACGTDIASKNITVNVPSSSTFATSACNSYTWAGTTYTTSGIYTKTGLVNRFGCDSTSILDLTINKSSTSSRVITICSNQLPYTWNGLTYIAADSKTYHTTNSVGCDSAATMDLVLNEYDVPAFAISSSKGLSVCKGDSTTLTVNGISNKKGVVTFTIGGTTYTDSITASSLGNAYLYANLGASISATSATIIANDACSPLPAGSLNGRFALIRRGTCTFATKAINARNAGAIGVIIYNNTGGSAAYTPGGVDTAVTFPVFGMSQTDGEALLTLLNANNNSINSNITAPKTYYTLTNGSADLSSPIAINTGKITKDTTISISVYAQSGQVTGANNIGYYVTNNCGNTQSILIKVAQPSSSVSNRSICNGDSLLFNGTYYKTAGTYTSKLTNSVGCDSSLVLNLTVLAPLKTSINHKICETALPFSINGLTFNEAGSQTQKLTSSNGCDSFVTHILSTVSDGIFDFATITQPKCDSVFGSINVNHYTISRKYKSSIDSLDKTQIGLLDINNLQSTACGDPIVVPSLVINDSRTRFYESYKFRNTSNQAKCFGFGLTNYNALHPLRVVAYLDSFVASNPSTNYLGNMQKISGSGNQYANVTVPAGRDIEFVVSNLNNGASYGDYIFEVSGFEPMEYSIDSGATWQTSKNFKVSQGKYNIAMRTGDTYCTQFYFDNPVLINSKKSTSSTQSIAVCPSALPYTWNSLTFTAAGSQTKTGLTNSQGCDSSATLNLTVKTNTLSTTNLSVCPSALPYSWNGLTFTATGSKTKTGLTNSQGCDSSATLNLIVSAAPVTNALNFSGCQQVVYKGKTYLNSTTFIDTAKNSLGCDSIYYTVYITVRNTTPVIQTQNLSGCKKLFFNGITYTTNTTLRDTLFSSFNCDSIYKITNITINTNCVYYVNTTFTVSMTNYLRTGNTIDTGGIRIAGNFADLGINLPNWTPTSPLCKLTKLGSTDDWSITIPIPDTSINKKLLFKFVNTNWDKNEGIDFGSELRNSTLCSVSDGGGNYNRFLVLPTNDSSVNYCWERCSLCNTTENAPTVTTGTITATTPNKVTVSNNNLIATGGLTVTQKGFLVSTNPIPNIYNNTFNSYFHYTNPSLGTYSVFIGGLYSNTQYYARAYASNAIGTSYGSIIPFVLCDTAKRDTLNLTGCGNVIYNGNTYASSNIKNDTLKTTLGCDSIYRVANITVKPTSASYHSATICANALPYSWNGNAYNAAGNYTAHFTNAVGCDSTANLKLIVNALPVISLNSSSNCLNTANLNLTGASNALQIVWQNNGATVNTTMLTAAAFGTTVAGGNPTSTLPNALNGPSSVFVDKNGVLYVGDLNNARIQRFAVGNLNATTVAGGYGIGVGLNQINSPSGVMVNDSNNVYVGDFGNHRVAKWLPNATIGIVVAGGNGSTNTSNAFNGVADIFVDAANNIYVADQNNHRIQKWTPGATSGVTVAGGNGAGSANNQINLPTAVFVDAVGNVYVGDYGNKRVTKWAVGATSGVTVAGGNGAGAANNQIDLLAGLYVDAIGNVYVADQNNHRIQKWTVGAITGITVAGGNGAGSNANQFKYPKDIYIDTAGAMYVPDNWNQRVQKWLQTINTSYIPTTAGVYTAIVTNNAGCTATSNVIAIAANVSPAISITANKLNVCAATKVRFNATISNGGSSPVYQWKRNGVNVGINSNTYLDSSFNAFDSVWCVLTSNATCVISPTVKSNVVQLIATQVPAQQNINLQGCTSVIYNGNSYFNSTTVNDTLKTVDGCDSVYKFININVTTPSSPANSIVPSFNNICFGAKIIFTATSSIQGANPIYKWYKNGLIVGTNASSYTDSLLNNQDSIWCVLTISETCVTANNIKSNVVKMNVSLAITGNIKTPTGNAISKVALYRKGSITDMQIVNSKYNSSCIDIANSVTLRPTKNNDVTKANGVTSVDVLLTQRHILNTTKLNSAYKLIAADVDGNKTINSVDVLRMKRLILGTDTTFTKTVGTVKTDRLWEFVDSSYAFPDTTNPFPFKDSISFTNLTSIKTNQSFIGVKLGDVNYDWNASMARQSVNSLQLTVDRKEQVSTIRYTLSTINFKDIATMQYTLHFDNSKYEFVNLEGFKNLTGFEYNVAQANNTGNIAMLWTDKNAQSITLEDGSELFTLVLKSKWGMASKEWGTNHLPLTINNSITDIEAWDKNFIQHNIVLLNKELTNNFLPITIDQWSVSPNPTSGEIKISIASIQNKTVNFELSDALGKTILKQSIELQKGNNNVTMNLKMNGNIATGVYFLKAVGLEGENVKRIIVK